MIRCDTCGLTKRMRVKNADSCQHTARIQCPCGAVFPVLFERRRHYRKTSRLTGSYQVLPEDETAFPAISQDKGTINCRIDDISLYGAAFSTLGQHRIKKGARIVLGFYLDDKNLSWIKKTGIVQRVEGLCIGMKFDEEPSPDKILGFYLRP